MSVIVGVPGAGHYRAGADPIADNRARTLRWARCLAEGLGSDADDVDLALAPYGRHLHSAASVWQGGGLDDLAADETAMLAELLAALDLPQATAHGRLTVPVRHAVAMAAERFGLDGRLTSLFVTVFFREVAAYLRHRDSAARLAARDEVASAIARHRPRVVIAHSLGTVVAFEALHAHPDLGVHTLITLGSPLALQRAVFQRLVPGPAGGVGTRPPGLARWVNISDPGDLVTIARPFTRYFPDIDVNVDDAIGLFDFHHATGYLRCGAVAAELRSVTEAF